MAHPVPVKQTGFWSGDTTADVLVDAFLDLQCPYSRRAFATLRELLGNGKRPPFRLRVLLFSVTHHRQSWELTRAAYALTTTFQKGFADVIAALYSHQEEFFNAVTDEMTPRAVESRLAAIAVEQFDVDQEAFLAALRSDAVHRRAKEPSRLASARGVWASPTFFVNEFEAEGLSSETTCEEWVTFLSRRDQEPVPHDD